MSRRTSRGAVAAALAGGLLALAACADPAPLGTDDDDPQAGVTTVTFRVWDDAAATAYRESFDVFAVTHRDILVDIEVVPWESYWSELEADLADGTAPDVFWTNTANVEQYARSGQLLSVSKELGDARDQWQPALVDLYTHDGQLWGVPQLWDAVVLYYNAEMVQRAGVDPSALTWAPAQPGTDEPAPGDAEAGSTTSDDDATPAADPAAPTPRSEPADDATDERDDDATPQPTQASPAEPAPAAAADGPRDSFLPAARALTVDAEGRTAAEEDFDPAQVVQYGFNAEPHLQAVLLPFLAQAGATFQHEDAFAFDSPEGVAALTYLSELVEVHHVAPPVDPRDRSDVGLEAFLDGRLALFQSGPYHLRQIAAAADFTWGIAPVVAGPEGPVSLVHGVVAAGYAHSPHGKPVTEVLTWIGSVDGQLALASQGVALPGAIEAESAYLDYWGRAGVDVRPFLTAAEGPLTAPPTGPAVQAGLEAIVPILAATLAGELPAAEAVARAQLAGNEALAAAPAQ